MHSSSIRQWLLTISLAAAAVNCSAVAERELHVVGIYEGVGGGRSATVHVNRPGHAVTLFLSSYDAIDWQVNVASGTLIERVFLNGYYRQTVQGIAPTVPVTARSYEDGTDYVSIGHHVGSSRFMRALPYIEEVTGQTISSFHGGYQPPASGFIIDSVQDDPRLSSSYPQPVPLSQLPDVRFQVATYDAHLRIRQYQLDGPEDGGPLIGAGAIMDADASGRIYYGGDDGLIEVDTQTGAVRDVPLLEEIRREGWQMGTAFDRGRGRALLVTLSGEGFLYGYTPALMQWNLRVSMQNRDLDCITYHDADESLYGITTSHDDSHYARIVKFTAAGAFLKDIELPVFPFDVGPGGGHRSELISAGEYLVLLLAPKTYPWASEEGESRIYLIDPRTSQVWLTHRETGPPNQEPEVSMRAPLDGSSVTPGSTIQLAAHAADRDGTISVVRFLVNDQVLGVGTRHPLTGAYVLEWLVPASGQHVIVAEATDDEGATVRSAPITVRVNQLPTVSIVAPAADSTVQLGTNVDLVASAHDPDGSVASVSFTMNGRFLGTGTRVEGSDRYSLSWQPTVPGTMNLRAVATDNFGGVGVPATVQIVVAPPVGDTVTATRILPPFYQAGKKLTVVITARPAPGAGAYTVVERPPMGWEVNSISAGGQFDPVMGLVTFGPFSDARPRALLYRVTAPRSATGVQLFSGSVEAGGVAAPVTGDSLVDTAPNRERQRLRPSLRKPIERAAVRAR